MKRFNSEEVGAWSTLRSPCVAELFGVVREGPYVLLFMDLKAGRTRSSLPLSHRGFWRYIEQISSTMRAVWRKTEIRKT